MFIRMIGKHLAIKQTNSEQGKTVFCYGQDGPDKFKQFAMASKARPGPHRDKREAKKEAKASKFRGLITQ